MFTRFEGTSFRGGINVVPPGQSSPLHTHDAEHVMLLLSGIADWVVAGNVFRLRRRYDTLFIPAGVPYLHRNPGKKDAMFFSVASKVDLWPASAHYDVS